MNKLEKIFRDSFDIHGDSADYDTIRERMVSGGKVTGTNMCVLVLAILIASIGLNMNSTAVIIGAMLISPLMGSILSAAYGIASADMKLLRKSLIGFVFQIIFCLITSTLYFKLSPISSETSELLARTQPTIWDVMIATCGGLAGIIGMTRKEKSNVIPGVAIATALMPPLCTCGYGIATGRWRFVGGAFYLFTLNSYFIFLASTIILIVLNVPRVRMVSDAAWKRLRNNLVRNTIIIIIPSLLFAGNMVATQHQENTSLTGFEKHEINQISLVEQISILFPEITDAEVQQTALYDDDGNQTGVQVNVAVASAEEIDAATMAKLDKWLDAYFDEDCIVEQKDITLFG